MNVNNFEKVKKKTLKKVKFWLIFQIISVIIFDSFNSSIRQTPINMHEFE